MRQNVQCEVCDFDPILYKKDWRKARLQVETKMQGTFNKFSVQMKDTIEFSEIQGTAAGKAKGPQVASALAPIDERVKSAMIVSAAEKAANEVRATGAAKSLLSLKPNAAPTKTP